MNQDFHFRILVTSDLHGHLLPIDYATGEAIEEGLSIVSTLIGENRLKNSILLDLGDSIQGSPLMSYHQRHRQECPNPVQLAMNEIGYDYFVPGNHDFNYGKEYLEAFIEGLHAKTLCANILDSAQHPAFGALYDIINVPGGPLIAIIGITTQYIPNWEKKTTIAGLVFENACEKAKAMVEMIREIHHPALVIVAYHGGFEKDINTFEAYVEDTGENLGSKMLEEIPGMDILITGHQHRSLAQKSKGVSILQPQCNGKALGVIDCYFEKEDNWSLVKTETRILETKGVPSDKKMEALLATFARKTEAFLDQPIGYVPNDDLWIDDPFLARKNKHKIVTLINQVQLEKSEAQLSCCSLGNHVTGFHREVTVRNVLSTYIFPNSLVVIRIDGKNLRKALEKNAEYFSYENGFIIANPKYSYPKLEHYNYDMFDGIEYVINVANPFGSRIEKLTYQGKLVRDRDSFTLAMNNYRATGGGEFSMYRGLPIVRELNLDIAELLTEYIRDHETLFVPETNNIQVIYEDRKWGCNEIESQK